jgi:hypothetical protein
MLCLFASLWVLLPCIGYGMDQVCHSSEDEVRNGSDDTC